jgi:hypothetical protein
MPSKRSVATKIYLHQQPSLLRKIDNSTPFSGVESFYQLMLHLVATLNKESSNNVALVIIAAMFFGFAALVLRPLSFCNAPPAINPLQTKFENNPTTKVIINIKQQQTQSQNQRPSEIQQEVEAPPSGS